MSLSSIAASPSIVVGKTTRADSVGPAGRPAPRRPRRRTRASRDPAVVVEREECDVVIAVRAAVLGHHRDAAVLGDDHVRIGRLVDRVDGHRELAERVAGEALEVADRGLPDVAPRHLARRERQLHHRVVGEQLDQLVDAHLVGELHDLAHTVDVLVHAVALSPGGSRRPAHGFLFPTTHIEKNCEPPPYA